MENPDKKEKLEEMPVNEIKTFIKNLVETIILKEREIFCQEEKDVGNGFFTRGIRTPVGEFKNLRVARTRYNYEKFKEDD